MTDNTVSNTRTFTTVDFGYFKKEIDTADGRTWHVIVPGTNPNLEMLEIGTSNIETAKSALRVVCDLLHLKKYGEPNAFGLTVGYHPLAKFDASKQHTELAGYVHPDNLSQNPKIMSIKFARENKEVWHKLEYTDGTFIAEPMEADADHLRKRSWINSYLKGYGLRIRVLPFQTYLDSILHTMETENIEEAAAIQVEGYRNAQANDVLWKTAQDTIKKVAAGEKVNFKFNFNGQDYTPDTLFGTVVVYKDLKTNREREIQIVGANQKQVIGGIIAREDLYQIISVKSL